MIKNYTEAANKLSIMAENCNDPQLSALLYAGSSKVLKLANESGLNIIKTAAKKEKDKK